MRLKTTKSSKSTRLYALKSTYDPKTRKTSSKVAAKLGTAEEIMELAERYAGDARVTTEDVERSALLRDLAEPWFFFAEGAWGRWFNGLALADDPDAVEFPLAGEVKPEYNVRGCAAVCRCAKTRTFCTGFRPWRNAAPSAP